MPPRTTRKSHRPRVSDRTMVGTAQPLCLSASETEGRRYDMTMNLGKSEITAPRYNAGLDDEMPSSRRGSVFLDIPFYRTGLSSTGLSRSVSAMRQDSPIQAVTSSRIQCRCHYQGHRQYRTVYTGHVYLAARCSN
jgi:hypothetical protein